jgi:hypothetical protein
MKRLGPAFKFGFKFPINLVQGRAGVLKRTTNEQRLMGPSDGWIKIGVGN